MRNKTTIKFILLPRFDPKVIGAVGYDVWGLTFPSLRWSSHSGPFPFEQAQKERKRLIKNLKRIEEESRRLSEKRLANKLKREEKNDSIQSR